jgi:hypothetical protein
MTTLRKREKAKKRRKDYEKKRNIARNKSTSHDEEVPKYKEVQTKTGRKVVKDGTKIVRRKNIKPRLQAGEGILPASRKHRLRKKEVARRKKAAGNVITTITKK